MATSQAKNGSQVILSVFSTCLLLYGVFAAFPAHAGLIIQRPNYTGLNQGLVGYWSFDGKDMSGVKALDRSGQGNDGTLTNGPTKVAGKVGQALSFDGVNDLITMGDVLDFTSTSLSFSAWVYRKAGGAEFSRIIDKDDNSDTGYMWRYDSGNGALDFYIAATGVTSAAKLTLNQWSHAALVYNGSNVSFYINGVLIDSPAFTAMPVGTTKAFSLGNILETGKEASAMIDEVRIYNRVLSAGEINRLYRIGATLHVNTDINTDSLQKGLVGWWTFDGKDVAGFPSGATPATVYDRSGQGNNGKYYNATGTLPVKGKLGQGILLNGLAVETGDGSYVMVGDADVLDVQTGDFTASAWLKHSNRFSNFISKSNCGSDNDWQMFTSNSIAGDYGFRTIGNAGNSVIIASSQGYPANVWHHVLGLKRGTIMQLYVDGVFITSGTQTEASSADSDPLMFGTRSGPLVNPACDEPTLDGTLDDVRIYNRALSADEIKRLYRIGGTLHVNTQINNDTLKNGLVGYWSFDGSDMNATQALDGSGQSNQGILTNGPKRVKGKIGQALNFDGVNDFIDINAAAVSSYPISMSLWVKLNGTDFQEGTALAVVDADEANGNELLVIDVRSYGAEYHARNGVDIGDTPGFSIASSAVAPGADWHHYVAISESATLHKFYIDGVLADTDTNSTTFPSVTKTSIGKLNRVGGQNFSHSVIDEVRVYNRALKADEIKRLYIIGGGR